MISGMLLGTALGLLTAVFFALVCRHTPTLTIQLSFVFVPVYCAACGRISHNFRLVSRRWIPHPRLAPNYLRSGRILPADLVNASCADFASISICAIT